MIPPQDPYEGGKPTMRKGSYSEELVRIVRFHADGNKKLKMNILTAMLWMPM